MGEGQGDESRDRLPEAYRWAPGEGHLAKTDCVQVGKLEPCLGFTLIPKRSMVVTSLLLRTK